MSNICNFNPIRLSQAAINERFKLIQKNLCYAMQAAGQADSNFVSVTEFGAVGDGSTDDSAAIQSAVNSGNPVIFFPAGTYNITTAILLPSNITLYGYGAVLFRAAAIDNLMRNNADGVTGGYTANTNIRFYGLIFDGNRANFPSNSTLLAIGHANTIIVQDCEFREISGAWHGLELNAVQDAMVEGCYFHDGSGQEHLQLDLMAGSSVFPWFGPYDSTPCKNIIVNGCLFTNGSGSGLGSHSGNDPNYHVDIIWSNNTFRNFGSSAMNPFNYKNLVISNNVVDGCVFGIAAFRTNVTGQTGWVISGNHLSNMTGFGRGMALQFLRNVTITGNTTDNSQDAGIFMQSCDGFTITGNTIRNAGQSTSVDNPGIDLVTCSNGYVSNNVVLKDAAGLGSGTNTIRIGTGVNTNITIEDNTCTTPGATTTFSITGTTTNIVVGSNTINGKILPTVSAKTANYTYTPTDSVLNVSTASGNITITIDPRIFNKIGLRIKKTTADVNTVIIATSSGTINGGASISLTTQNQVALITSDWTNLDAAILT